MTTTTETAYAVGLLVARFLVGNSGKRLQQIAKTGQSIALLRGLQTWCREAEIAIDHLIVLLEESNDIEGTNRGQS